MLHYQSFIYLLFAVIFLSTCAGVDDSENVDYLPVKIAGNDYWSIIDVNSGEIIIRDEFKNAPSAVSDGLFFVEKDKGNGYDCFNVDNISKPINKTPYIKAGYFHDGVAPVWIKDDKIAIIDKECKEVIVFGKDVCQIHPFMNGYAVAGTKDKKMGILNSRGEWVVKAVYEQLLPFSSDGYTITMRKQNDTINTYDVISKEGVKLYSFTSEKYIPFVVGMVNGNMTVLKDKKVLYIDSYGNRVLDVGKYLVGTEPYYGIYNGLTIYASEDGKMGVMTDKGEKLIRDKYDLLIPTRDGKFIAYRDNKCGLIDKDDKVLMNFEFMKIQKLKDNRYLVKEKENSYSIVDEKGNEVCRETLSAVVLKEDKDVFIDINTKLQNFDNTQIDNDKEEKKEEEADEDEKQAETDSEEEVLNISDKKPEISNNTTSGDNPLAETYCRGRIGGDYDAWLQFDNSSSGSYGFLQFVRIVKFVSYNNSNHSLILNAYEQGSGKFIGKFVGKCFNTHFTGTFTNYKGGQVTFDLDE